MKLIKQLVKALGSSLIFGSSFAVIVINIVILAVLHAWKSVILLAVVYFVLLFLVFVADWMLRNVEDV